MSGAGEHRPDSPIMGQGEHAKCAECGEIWPCPTARAGNFLRRMASVLASGGYSLLHKRDECSCCGRVHVRRGRDDPWEGRLNDYCEDCGWLRCDAFPGACRA